ncbi:MAG: acyl-CoA carboxylase subunit beta [Bacillota bacterium]
MSIKTHESEAERLRLLMKQAVEGGGGKAQDKIRSQGRLTARERIDNLMDPGSFVEFNMLAVHQCHNFGMEKKKFTGDGVVTGYGRIEGRLVFVYSQDATVLGGSVGPIHGEKICYTIDQAIKARAPVIGIYDSGGGRIHEGFTASRAVAGMFHRNTRASGVIPQIAAIMGTCAGVAVYSPAIMDFIFMVDKTSHMFITGPGVIKTVTGEDIDFENLGGAPVHSTISGNSHFVAPNDKECLSGIRRLLSFLPPNNQEKPARVETGDDPDRTDDSLVEKVPADFRFPYDMREVIKSVVDNGDFMEVQPDFAQNIVIGLARLDGYTVGVLGNQPMVMAGCLDINASDKSARFIRFCDAFNIPLINMVDVPGFLPGKEQEYGGIIRHGGKMLYAYAEATVPKITLVLRKNYGGAVMAMCCKGSEVDQMLAWPIAQLVVLDTTAAVDIIFRKEIQQAEKPEEFRQKMIEQYDHAFSNPFDPAGKMLVDAVIEPRYTRPALIKSLRMLLNKVEERPWRKHGNIPL